MIHVGMPNVTTKVTEIREQDIQPNSIDVRVGSILRIKSNVFSINEESKTHRGSESIEVETDGYYNLSPGSYEVVMENQVSVGDGEAGFIIVRSTFNRNGCFLTSGLYDSGYQGVVAAVLHVNVGNVRIQPGTRIGQFLCWKAQTSHVYDGDYGLGKAYDEKYIK
jgi:deoxycytidine triphosphate deaminase